VIARLAHEGAFIAGRWAYELRCRLALRLIGILMRVLPADIKRASFAKCIKHSGCFGFNKP
jgi:hypothetical protein